MMPIAAAQLRTLYDQLIDMPSEARESFIAQQIPDPALAERLRRMLQITSGDLVFDQPLSNALQLNQLPDASALPEGTIFGQYTLQVLIGEGGSAQVYRATRELEGLRQTVALKLLHRSLRDKTAQRQFFKERSALSALQHPNIAQLIDGGVEADGTAYIVLEYIDGLPISQYAAEARMSIRDRLLLFLQLARAMAEAHRALIVHRDLKPGNVLVRKDGRVKVLDFGIAKLLDAAQDTETQFPSFTPAYAAPEQRNGGRITTATDVYAMGIVLGELLTGQRITAEHKTPSAAITGESIAAQLPGTLRQTQRLLKGDIDNIFLKAVALEPEQRYASALEMADDIGNLLAGLPVRAHPPSRGYRARKFVQRHRGGVALTALFLIAVLGASALAFWQANVARNEAQRANAMRDFIITAFREASPKQPGDGPPRITEVVASAIQRINMDAAMNPRVRTELMSELGGVLREQGNLDAARAALEKNYAQAKAQFGVAAPLTLRAGIELLATLHASGKAIEASQLLIAELITNAPADALKERSEILMLGALTQVRLQDFPLAVTQGRSSVALARQYGKPAQLSMALIAYSQALYRNADRFPASANVKANFSETLQASNEALALMQKLYGAKDSRVAGAHASLARIYRRAGDLTQAMHHVQSAMAIDKAISPPRKHAIATHLNALTLILRDQRDYQAALAAAREALRLNREIHGPDHYFTAQSHSAIGNLSMRLLDFSGAITPLRESLRVTQLQFAPTSRQALEMRIDYGAALLHSGQVQSGEADILSAIADLGAAAPPDSEEIARTWEILARARLMRQALELALQALDAMQAAFAQIKTPAAYWNGRSNSLRATALIQQGNFEQARPLIETALLAVKAPATDIEVPVELALLQVQLAQQGSDPALTRQRTESAQRALAAVRNPSVWLAALSKVALKGP